MTHEQAKAVLQREVKLSGYNQHWLTLSRNRTRYLAESVVLVNNSLFESERARTRHIVRGIVQKG